MVIPVTQLTLSLLASVPNCTARGIRTTSPVVVGQRGTYLPCLCSAQRQDLDPSSGKLLLPSPVPPCVMLVLGLVYPRRLG